MLDGGDGSNFLTGGKLGSGTDTFFLDARNASANIWSTVSNFHAGDAVTLFGFTPTNSRSSDSTTRGPRVRPASRFTPLKQASWTHPGEVESSPDVKGDLDDQAATIDEGV